MKKYQAYIFDLYGTLIDIHTDESKDLFWKKNSISFSGYGAKYEWEELRDAYFHKVKKLEEKIYQEGHRIEIELRDVFVSLLQDKGVDGTDEMIEDIAYHFRKDSTSHIRLYAGVKELLECLHQSGKKVFLLSNAQEIFTVREMKDLGICDLFDEIFISSMYGYKKPDPYFFEVLLKKHDLDPKNCLMIGNDLYDDIAGADQVNMDTYYIHSKLSSDRKAAVKATYTQEGMDLKKLKQKIVTSFKEKAR